jgi:23S rRNA (uracil1939-C5)-methyltransferase
MKAMSIQPEKEIVDQRCPVWQTCGGCQLQGLSYPRQLALKQQRLEQLLGRFSPVAPIIGADHPGGYRNKVQVTFGRGPHGRLIWGNYALDSHQIVAVRQCQIAFPRAAAIFADVARLAVSFRLSPYDEDRREGFLRHAMLRCDAAQEQFMLVLVTAGEVFPRKQDFLKELAKRQPGIVTVVQNVNRRRTSQVLSDRSIVLSGPGCLTDTLLGHQFRISPTSFYQVNHEQTERLYRTAIAAAGFQGDETVLDAYCGIGTIGISLADQVKQVVGVELNREAVRDARGNARRNGIGNIRFYAGDAGRFLQESGGPGETFDVVMMDPPRSGADGKFLAALLRARPQRIVYISCEPETLARDVARLSRGGYRVKLIQPVDMFPFTRHVETVCLLLRDK